MSRARLRTWIPIAPFAAGLVVLGVGLKRGLAAGSDGSAGVAAIDGGPPAAPRVDPSALAPSLRGSFPAWADPRWETELLDLVTAWPDFPAGDAASLRAFGAAVGSLSFVETLDSPRVGRGGDGRHELVLGFQLREPVACVRSGAGFLTVAADGTVLSGLWSAPPEVGGRWLPLLAAGPGAAFELAEAGDWLGEPEHLDALDVAVSMHAHLEDADFELLGRVVIDASRGRLASPEEPGVRLALEDERLVLFGRPPAADEPGELPTATKWDSVQRAVGLLAGGPEERAWDLADVRWDLPELRKRELEVPTATTWSEETRPVASPAAPRDATRDEPRPAADDDRPRVR